MRALSRSFPGAALLVATVAHAGMTNLVVEWSFDGLVAAGALGDAGNSALTLDFNALLPHSPPSVYQIITSIGWDVTIETVGPSQLSQTSLYFNAPFAPVDHGVYLTPGVAQQIPGTMRFVSDGLNDLGDHGVNNVFLDEGIVRLEFLDGLDDASGAADAYWSGTVFFGLRGPPSPAPGALSAFIVAGAGATLRRRRALFRP